MADGFYFMSLIVTIIFVLMMEYLGNVAYVVQIKKILTLVFVKDVISMLMIKSYPRALEIVSAQAWR